MKRPTIRLLAVLLLAMSHAVSAFAFPAGESGTAVREVRGFDKVELSIPGKLILTQGITESLEIEASTADLARISTAVSRGTLRIGQARPNDTPQGPITYRLVMKDIAGLAADSSGSIEVERVVTDVLAIRVHSSGSISVGTLTAKTLAVEISSSGSVTVAGTVDRQTLTSSSSGEYRAENLASREATCTLSSSGRATIRVSDLLIGTLSSSGDLRYRGNPGKVTVNTSSSGKLVKLE